MSWCKHHQYSISQNQTQQEQVTCTLLFYIKRCVLHAVDADLRLQTLQKLERHRIALEGGIVADINRNLAVHSLDDVRIILADAVVVMFIIVGTDCGNRLRAGFHRVFGKFCRAQTIRRADMDDNRNLACNFIERRLDDFFALFHCQKRAASIGAGDEHAVDIFLQKCRELPDSLIIHFAVFLERRDNGRNNTFHSEHSDPSFLMLWFLYIRLQS